MASPLDSHGFSDALVILGAAGIVIPTFARFRISPVIGFILTGMLVGPQGLGALVGQMPWLSHLTISDVHAIEPFAEFGIVLLLFSIGLELSLKRLWSMRALVFGVGAGELLGSGLVIATLLYATGLSVHGSLGLGIALALSSTALVLPMVGTTGAVGRPAFAMLLFEDLALVPIIFVLGLLAPMAAAQGTMDLARVALVGLVTVGAMMVAGRLFLPPLFAQAARTKSPELFLAASLLVVIIASLVTTAAGLSPIVGALLAGILIAETEYVSEVEVMTAPFKGLALGVFLITVGMGLDLALVARAWPRIGAAVAVVVIVKAAVTFGLLRLSGIRAGTAAETGLLMGNPSETTLIMLGAATQAGLILPATGAFWAAVTAIGLTITPLLAWLGQRAARRIEQRHEQHQPMPDLDPEGPGTIIIGCGRVGRIVADLLRAHGKRFVTVEADIDAARAASDDGYPVIFGDVARAAFADRLHLGRADALVLTMDDPVLSVRFVRRVRGWVPGLTIVARARDAAHAAELYRAGVTDAVPETMESSLQLSEAVLVDLGVAMGPVIASVHEKRDELRKAIKDQAGMEREPRIRRVRKSDAAG